MLPYSAATAPTPVEASNLRHDRVTPGPPPTRSSTGIRDGNAPSEERYSLFEKFCPTNGLWTEAAVRNALDWFAKKGNHHGTPSSMIELMLSLQKSCSHPASRCFASLRTGS